MDDQLLVHFRNESSFDSKGKVNQYNIMKLLFKLEIILFLTVSVNRETMDQLLWEIDRISMRKSFLLYWIDFWIYWNSEILFRFYSLLIWFTGYSKNLWERAYIVFLFLSTFQKFLFIWLIRHANDDCLSEDATLAFIAIIIIKEICSIHWLITFSFSIFERQFKCQTGLWSRSTKKVKMISSKQIRLMMKFIWNLVTMNLKRQLLVQCQNQRQSMYHVFPSHNQNQVHLCPHQWSLRVNFERTRKFTN